MEKIKTPVQAKIQEIKDSINADMKILGHHMDREEEQQIIESIETREIQIMVLESILPTERDMIEKAHNDGTWGGNSKAYFTQTFESCERT